MNLIELKEKLSGSKLAKGFIITLIGSGASKLILMLATFFFTNLLSKEDFGSFSFIRNTLNIILCICALNYIGLITKYTAEIDYKPKSKVHIALVALFSLIICIIIGLLLLILPKEAMNKIIGTSSLIGYFRIIGLLLPLLMLQPLVEGILRGAKHFKLIGSLQIITAFLFIIFVITGILLYGVNGAIIGLLLYYFIYSIISVFVIVRKTDFFRLFKNISLKELRTESFVIWTMILPVFILSFVEAPINWWAQVLMTKYDSMGSIGSMSAILQIRNLLIIIPNYYFSTFTTFQASLNAQGNQAKYFKNLKKTFWICLLIGILGSLVLSSCGNFVLGLYGDSYKSDIQAFYIAMAAFPMLITISLMKSNLLIKEHQRFMLIISILSSILQLITMYILLPLGVSPTSAYFWGQIIYCTISFISFGYCCIIDKNQYLK